MNKHWNFEKYLKTEIVQSVIENMDDEADDFECTCDDCMSQKPTEPLPSDCCGSGCQPCVNDLYEADIKAWRKACYIRHHGEQDDEKERETVVIETSTYRTFQLESIKKVSPDSFCYRFTLPNKGSLNLCVGQHLVLRAHVNDHQITRQYTPISPLKAKGYFGMLIKLYDKGAMSSCIRQWNVGDMIEWRGPYGSYQYQQNKYNHILMLAAGTGIAPMIQIIQHIVHNEEEDTFVRLLYACRTYQDILLREELNQLAAFWNFTVVYVLSQENKTQCTYTYGEDVRFGKLEEQVIEQELAPNTAKSQALICGTKSFDKDMIKYLRKLKYEGDIFKF